MSKALVAVAFVAVIAAPLTEASARARLLPELTVPAHEPFGRLRFAAPHLGALTGSEPEGPRVTDAAAATGGADSEVEPGTAPALIPPDQHKTYLADRWAMTFGFGLASVVVGGVVGALGGLAVLSLAVLMAAVSPGATLGVLAFAPIIGAVLGAGTALLLTMAVLNIFYPPPELRDHPEPAVGRNTLNLSPFAPLTARWSIEYERVLGPVIGVFFSPIVVRGASTLQISEEVFGMGANAGVRIYPAGKAPGCIFIQPQLHIEQFSSDRDGRGSNGKAATYEAAGAGVAVGQTYLFGHFMFSLGLGGAVEAYNLHVDATGREPEQNLSGSRSARFCAATWARRSDPTRLARRCSVTPKSGCLAAGVVQVVSPHALVSPVLQGIEEGDLGPVGTRALAAPRQVDTA